MAESLNVWFENQRVGELLLATDGNTMSFHYADDWIGSGFAISHSLPLAVKNFSAEEGLAHRWFANLLPEENARVGLAKRLGIADNDFSLLRAIGGDCAGALEILPAELSLDFTNAQAIPLDSAQLERWALGKERFALISLDQPQLTRLSLAGAQDKIPVLIQANELLLPQGRTPSSHLLKFSAKPALILNELCMNHLAQLIGLPCPETRIARAGKSTYLSIARYDRTITNSQLKRVHQEDFCQALGFSRTKKYQQDGGPTLVDCAQLVRRLSAQALHQLLRWQLFNVLAGNSDGHAKNLSLLLNGNNLWSLSPVYDLVCTQVMQLDPHLGFAIGQQYHPQKLTRRDWEMFARSLDISIPFVLETLKNMAEQLAEHAHSETLKQALMDAGMTEKEWVSLQHLRKYVTQQCKKAKLWLV